MNVCLINYAAGNIFSLKRAFTYLGYDVVVSCDPDIIAKSDTIVLPGVGSFPSVMQFIHQQKIFDCIKNSVTNGQLLVGICLGMQLFYERSSEGGCITNGFGFLSGDVDRLPASQKWFVPHIGWSSITFCDQFYDAEIYGYFAHSFYATHFDDSVKATIHYCDRLIPAVVSKNNIIGFQFHPEISGMNGIHTLSNLINKIKNKNKVIY